jgi:hypothetical protein
MQEKRRRDDEWRKLEGFGKVSSLKGFYTAGRLIIGKAGLNPMGHEQGTSTVESGFLVSRTIIPWPSSTTDLSAMTMRRALSCNAAKEVSHEVQSWLSEMQDPKDQGERLVLSSSGHALPFFSAMRYTRSAETALNMAYLAISKVVVLQPQLQPLS